MIRTATIATVKKMAAEPGSNVVVLPTAAPRQVRQTYNRHYREAKAAMRAWPGDYIPPFERRVEETARTLLETEITPALLLATAILTTLTDESLAKVVGQILPGAIGGRPANKQAMAVIKGTRMNVGDQVTLRHVIKRLSEQGQ